MNKFLVTRIIHETAVIEANTEEEAIEAIGHYEDKDLTVICTDIHAEPEPQEATPEPS